MHINIIMSLIHYKNEIIKIGVKFQIPSVVLKMIYDFNKNNYPNHFNVFMLSPDKLFKLNMKYCYKNDFYYNHKCAYCENCPRCNKYLGISNHYYCVKCYDCSKYPKTHCDYCDCCYKPDTHKFCKFCNKCHDIKYLRCEQCNKCYNIDYDTKPHKYCNSDHLYNLFDKKSQLEYYLDKSDNSKGSLKRYYAFIILRLSVAFIQDYANDIKKKYIITVYDKINQFIDDDKNNNILSTKEYMLICRYKSIIKKYIDNIDL